jgi:hypothetical protein
MNGATKQAADQTVKGGILGIGVYIAHTKNIDPALVAMLLPVASAVLAFISSKISDPHLASIFGNHKELGDNKDEKK